MYDNIITILTSLLFRDLLVYYIIYLLNNIYNRSRINYIIQNNSIFYLKYMSSNI